MLRNANCVTDTQLNIVAGDVSCRCRLLVVSFCRLYAVRFAGWGGVRRLPSETHASSRGAASAPSLRCVLLLLLLQLLLPAPRPPPQQQAAEEEGA